MPTPDVGAVAHVRVLTRSRACCAICNVVKERVAPTSLESINRSLAHSRTHSVVDCEAIEIIQIDAFTVSAHKSCRMSE